MISRWVATLAIAFIAATNPVEASEPLLSGYAYPYGAGRPWNYPDRWHLSILSGSLSTTTPLVGMWDWKVFPDDHRVRVILTDNRTPADAKRAAKIVCEDAPKSHNYEEHWRIEIFVGLDDKTPHGICEIGPKSEFDTMLDRAISKPRGQ